MKEVRRRRYAGGLAEALGNGTELHDEIVNLHGQQHPGVLRAKFAPVHTTVAQVAGKLAVLAGLCFIETLLNSEAAGKAVRVDPMRAIEKFAADEVFEPG